MSDNPTVNIEDGVCVVRLDDGKANAIGHDVIDALHAALDRSATEASAFCVIGREGRFSAGFDLSVLRAGPDATRGLVGAGGKLFVRLFTHPQPTVAAVTGHAIAAGALLTLACDTRIGADVDAKIGLNETAIGMGMPWYGIELPAARLSSHHMTRAVLQAELYSPAGAVEAGYLDRVVAAGELEDAAVAEARRLGELSGSAYAFTKARLRTAVAERISSGIDGDMSEMVPPG